MKSGACDAWLCSCIACIEEYEIDDPCIPNQGTKIESQKVIKNNLENYTALHFCIYGYTDIIKLFTWSITVTSKQQDFNVDVE